MTRQNLAVLIALAAVLVPAGRAVALEPHLREGWVAGLGVGGARGEITFVDDVVGEIEDGFSPQIRLGRMVSDRLAVGVSYAGWIYETGVLPFKYRFSLQNLLLAATWYPGDPDAALGGLSVRLGAGLGWSSLAAVEVSDGEEQGHGERITDAGLGIEFGLGYEFRVARHAAVGLGVGAHFQDLEGEVYRTATFVPACLNLALYW